MCLSLKNSMVGKLLCADGFLVLILQVGDSGPWLRRETEVTAQPSLPLFPGSHCSAGFGQEWHLGSLEPVSCVYVEVMATAVSCAGHGHEISPQTLCADRR